MKECENIEWASGNDYSIGRFNGNTVWVDRIGDKWVASTCYRASDLVVTGDTMDDAQKAIEAILVRGD